MFRREGDGGFDIVSCCAHGLVRQAVHQVNVDLFETGIPGGNHRLAGLVSIVNAAKRFKLGVAETLQSQGQPIYPRASISRKTRLIGRPRIGL